MKEFNHKINCGLLIEDYFELDKIDNSNFEELGYSDRLSEKECSKIVDSELNGGYVRYNSFIDMSGFNSCETARESLKTLLDAHKIENNCLIFIKKQ